MPPDLARPQAAFGVAMIAVLWTYEAWYFVTYASGEIKNPQRNIPRALVVGILILIVIYVLVNVAYLHALTIDEMKGTTRIAERAATALVGPTGATFVALTVVVSTFGNNGAALLAGSRLLFAMAQRRCVPSRRAPGAPALSNAACRHRRADHLVVSARAFGHLRAALHVCHVRVDPASALPQVLRYSDCDTQCRSSRDRIGRGDIRSCRWCSFLARWRLS